MKLRFALLSGTLLVGLTGWGARADTPPPSPVTAYSDGQFTGRVTRFASGRFYDYHWGHLEPAGNDAISSLRVARGYKARACEHDAFGGCRDFGAGEYGTLGSLEDRISYLEVRRTGEAFLSEFEAQDQLAATEFKHRGRDRPEFRFGGLYSRLERCFRPKPAGEVVRCDLHFRQLEGRSLLNLQTRSSSLRLFDNRFHAYALRVEQKESTLQVLQLEAPQTARASYFFRVPTTVKHFHYLEYNLGDVMAGHDKVILK